MESSSMEHMGIFWRNSCHLPQTSELIDMEDQLKTEFESYWRPMMQFGILDSLDIKSICRAEIPPETGFIVGIKMNSVEFQDQGLQNEDAVIMCREFEVNSFLEVNDDFRNVVLIS